MKKHLLLIMLCCCSGVLSAQDIIVEKAYIRAMPPTVNNTAAYMRIINQGDQHRELIGAYSSLAASTLLHETIQEDGMMRMEHLMSLNIEEGGVLILEPGGKHFMLMGIEKMPVAGDEVQLVLRFRDGNDVPLTIKVVNDSN